MRLVTPMDRYAAACVVLLCMHKQLIIHGGGPTPAGVQARLDRGRAVKVVLETVTKGSGEDGDS